LPFAVYTRHKGLAGVLLAATPNPIGWIGVPPSAETKTQGLHFCSALG